MSEESDYRSRTHTRKRIPLSQRTVHNGLTNISFYMPVSLFKQIDALTEEGNYLNRAELIRHALREFIDRELLTKYGKSELEAYYDEVCDPLE